MSLIGVAEEAKCSNMASQGSAYRERGNPGMKGVAGAKRQVWLASTCLRDSVKEYVARIPGGREEG